MNSSVYLRLAFLESISSPGTKTEKTSALRDSPAPDCSAERTAASGRTKSVHRSTSDQTLWTQMRWSKEICGAKTLPGDRFDYKRKWREQERPASPEVSRKRCAGLSGGITEVSERSPEELLYLINRQTSCPQIKVTFHCLRRDCAIYTTLALFKWTGYRRSPFGIELFRWY